MDFMTGTAGVFDNLDAEQFAAVTCDVNAVVEAGAGAGKTRVLACRYVLKVLQGVPVERILTLTFTNKAVAEMHSRIYGLLSTIAAKGSGPAKEKAAKGMADFGNDRIQTLDSYCAAILRRSASRFGISPDFTVDDSGCRELAEKAALPFLLSHRENPALKQLFALEKPEALAVSLFARSAYGLAEDFDSEQAFSAQAEEVRREWKKTAPEVSALMKELGAEESAEAAEANPLAFLLAACEAAKIRKNKGNGETLEALRDLIPLFSSIVVFLAQEEVLREVFRLVGIFHGEFVEKKHHAGIVSYTDVSYLAGKTLRDEADIRAEERNAYDHIMIDEFQDNNGLQKEILFAAAGENTRLFFVGDEKQSIYRFRGADVTVFRQLALKLTAEGGSKITLKTNYRSEKDLVYAFNALFPFVFTDDDDAPDYEARFGAAAAGKITAENFEEDTEKNAGSGCPVEVYLMETKDGTGEDEDSTDGDGSDFDDKYDAEANFVAWKIRELHEDGVPYGNIAVLLRTFSHLDSLEKAFFEVGIPFGSEKIGNFFADAVVNDLTAWLRLLVYPKDVSAYAAVLRSPMAGMSYAGVMVLLSFDLTKAALAEGNPFPSIDGDLLSAADRTAYERAKKLYRSLREKKCSFGAADLLGALWYGAGYRYESLWSADLQPYADRYDYLFEIARQKDNDGSGLPGFVDALKDIRVTGKKLEELRVVLERAEEVRIMSIHASKGLEFPVVFLCNVGSRGKNSRSETLCVSADSLAVKAPLPASLYGREKISSTIELRHNYFFEKARGIERKRDQAELKRLLYVALTRAEKRLVITGSAASSKDPATLADYLLPGLEKAGIGVSGSIPWEKPGVEKRSPRTKGEVLKSLSEKFREVQAVPAGRASRTHIAVTELSQEWPGPSARSFLQESEESREEVQGNLGAADFGTCAHSVIASMLSGKTPMLPAGISASLRAAEKKAVMESCTAMGRQFLATELGRMAEADSGRRIEWPFRALLESGRFADGVMDLVFSAKGVTYVVDFKTDAVEMPELHEAQLRSYLEAARFILGRECRGALFYLRTGRTAWIE